MVLNKYFMILNIFFIGGDICLKYFILIMENESWNCKCCLLFIGLLVGIRKRGVF